MEVLVGVNSDYRDYKVIEVATGNDISRFCWAADDIAGLYAVFENDGNCIISTPFDPAYPDEGSYIESWTYEEAIKLVRREISID